MEIKEEKNQPRDEFNKNDKDKKKFISLKEAAHLTGYNPDYIGQLIRAGEIPGKPIYREISWVTTAEAVLAYKNRKNRKRKQKSWLEKSLDFFLVGGLKRRVGIQIQLLKLFVKTFRWALVSMIIICLCFAFLIFFIFSQGAGNNSAQPDRATWENLGGENIQDFSY